ncbi:hypothetical protein F511_02714 [Dorcoceras hygrometricum]|uniref:Uncharacterized protein n=1 Tax=Dorcoceras hygrometricum TaxID=472368 RepID=A0A2Z7CLX8_9LAMI|nr:hypothetical protein F511_02714 [Dorcoceras hygrometricum]
MDNARMVSMFESLVATGLKGFLGCPAVIHEAALLEFFENGSVRDGLVVSTVNGVTVEISEQLLAETFELSVEAAEVASETTMGEPAVEVAGETVVEESAVANVLEEQQRETVVYDFVEVPEETVVEGIAEPDSEPAVADVANTGMSIADDVDIIIGQVLAETAQIGPDEKEQDIGGLDVVGTAVSESGVGEQAAPKADELEQWFNLSYEEFHARLDADRPIETDSDTDEDMETVEEMETEAVEQSADEAMSLEDILMTIPVECPLPSANVEIPKITLGKSISIPRVNEGEWYKADLPKIPAADKGKAPLMERDPVKGNPVKEQFSLILADIEVLVQLREQIIDDVDRFFNSFSLKKLANLKIDESYFDKKALILSWAETDSTRVALNRRMYILTKYRELLIRKFLEARKINFIPGEGSSASDLKVLEMLSDLHMFVVEDLKERTMAHGLRWEKTCCSKIFEGRPRDRGAVIARTNTNTRSTCWIRTMICVDGVWVIEPCGDHWVKIPHFVSTIALDRSVLRDVQLVQSSVFVSPHVQFIASSAVENQNVQLLLDQRPQSPSTIANSSMHFVEDDIQLEDDSAPDQFILTSSAAAISASIAALQESFSNFVANQPRDSWKTHNALNEATRKEVKDIKAALSKDFDDKLADIRNELLEFHVDTLGLRDAGIDQLNFHSVQLDYLVLLQMGNTDPNKTKAGNKYEVKPHPSQLGGRHSYPVVTAPTIALDFSGTTQQSASHNVAPNQALATRTELNSTRNAHPKAHASRRTHAQIFLKSFELQQLRVSTPALIQRLKRVATERAKQGKSSATKIVKNKGWMRWKSREEMSR